MTRTKSVIVGGDKLTVTYNGSVWESSWGEQFARADAAMYAEIAQYFESIGVLGEFGPEDIWEHVKTAKDSE